MDQKSMRTVNFHHIETGGVRARRRPAPSLGHGTDLLARERARNR